MAVVSWDDYECKAASTISKAKHLQTILLPILDLSQEDMRNLLHKYPVSVHYPLKALS